MNPLSSRTRIIAHRGASWDAPENTLAAFRLAWEEGADGVEGDFRLTRDGRVVCLHDESALRTAGRDLRAAEATLDELRALDAGVWKGDPYRGERIPTLEEVLGTVPQGRGALLDVKGGPEVLAPLGRAVVASGIQSHRVALLAFRPAVLAEARRRLPGLKVHLLVAFERDGRTGTWRPDVDEVLGAVEEAGADGVDLEANLDVVDRSFVASLRARGLELHAWTVNEAEAGRRLADLGFDSITTDRPGHLRRALE